ncbi:hypothetical protein SAMN02745163_03789 [Clostridium cavendishii DSM 21758]|uniref:Uncharacterized protein n=1 Tax=Clostridium cavendishii DSM 21758 TaxID=1121302 RepID=A0A1M6SEE3_9CLOT|nr:hypothetical protein [Clostridium cavendishii]SHK43091.1 hypothetical protein SAMN02745163_03789 [Clostridium cavendishii DSM 21758]
MKLVNLKSEEEIRLEIMVNQGIIDVEKEATLSGHTIGNSISAREL